MSDTLALQYLMVEVLVLDFQSEFGITSDEAMERIRGEFDSKGSYEFAKEHGLLVSGSGEEFACQFMACYNEYRNLSVY